MDDDQRLKDGRSAADTSEYSGSLAPETQEEARRESRRGDDRLTPGSGGSGQPNVGASGLNRDDVPSGAEDPELTTFGEMESETGRGGEG